MRRFIFIWFMILQFGACFAALSNDSKAAAAQAGQEMAPIWTYNFEQNCLFFPPFISGDSVYLLKEHSLLSIDLATGKKKWEASFVGTSTSEVMVADGVAVFLRHDPGYELIGLDASSGKQLWTYQPKGHRLMAGQTLALAGHLAYIIDSELNLDAVDIKTGKLKWSQPGIKDEAEWGYPIVLDGNAYLTKGGKLYAVDALTGKKKWVGQCYNLFGVGSKKVWFQEGEKPVLVGVDSKTGSPKWKKKIPGLCDTSIISVTRKALFYYAKDKFCALNLETGTNFWIYNAPKKWPTYGSVEADDRYTCFEVAVADTPQGDVYDPNRKRPESEPWYYFEVLDTTTGKLIWEKPSNHEIAPYTLHQDLLFIYDDGGKLAALDVKTGRQLWYSTQQPGNLFFAKDTLLVIHSNIITALKLPGLMPSPLSSSLSKSDSLWTPDR